MTYATSMTSPTSTAPTPVATLVRATLAASVALVMMATPASALSPTPAPGGRCGDGFAGAMRADRGPCKQFAAAPRLASSHPLALAALAVWGKLAEPVEALTERTTGIVLLAPEAVERDGRPFAPAAWICPSTPPIIYVPFPLLEAVYASSPGTSTGLGEDFLAFVLAHELGHRVNDFTIDGCPAAFGGDGANPDGEPERRADFRGAFFAAVAGYDPRSLVRAGTVARFLEAEFRVRPSDIKARTAALDQAFGWFDALEEVYQAGLALTLIGERGAAARFLGRLDERLDQDSIPLPEVTLVHALALMSDASAAAPWLDALERLPAPLEPLVCRTVHPSHGAFADDLFEGRVRADPARREAARRAIERARRLIERASALGAAPLAVASAKACAALLANEAGLARSLSESARKSAERASTSVLRTLDANVALARFVEWLAETPAPPEGHSTRPDWLARLAAARPAFVASAALDRYVANLVGLPSTPPLAGAPKCGVQPAIPPAPLPQLGSLAAPAGACPAGWERFDDGNARSDIAICRKANQTLVRTRLPPLADPPLPAIDTAILLFGAPPPLLRNFEAWTCGCDHLSARGVTDVGESAWLGSCPRLGMSLGLVLSDARGRVRRIMIVP